MDVRWTLSELVAEAAASIATLPAPKNGQVRPVPDERTVRYYGTIGLLDRPVAMRGRTALYNRRHLAQVVAIKRLQSAGRSLAEIQTLWPTLDAVTLARMSGIELAGTTARREFWKRAPYHTGRSAAQFLGTNLAGQLAFRTGVDDVAYGMTAPAFTSITNTAATGNKRDQVANFGKSLAVAAKAFEMGLTASVVLPSLRDDPHGAFGTGGNLTAESTAIIGTLRTMLDAFLADLGARQDSVTHTSLAEDVVITIEGDTPKTPLVNATWPDNTPQQSNWMFVFGGGKLKTGWFGGIDRNGGVTGFDPHTGLVAAPNPDLQAKAAVAAVAYAITRGDIRRVQDFTPTDIAGLIV